ncbi:MAG: tRNA lysidine(34) synthetase TilS [Marmoricola sp.]|nr:tRNA lysidine(34) synthetase TilS [Marmoricola sp.]
MSLDPALAAVRRAVRREVGGVGTVMVACSGGADSLALLAAAVFEGDKAGTRVIGAVIDHGLQQGSAEHTAAVVDQMAALGADETATIRVTVDPGPAGIEAGAREARYVALSQLAAHLDSDVVLLGHTLDDQAETVLLGLARGSGGRSLQGMRPSFEQDGVRFARPLLAITRAETESACRADDISWWEDPHNADPGFLRSRVRHVVMPMLEAELGPRVAEALARTADQLRDDMAFIETQAEQALEGVVIDGGIDLGRLASAPAVATRGLRMAAIRAGAIPSELTYAHIQAILDAGPGKEIQLPGHITAVRQGGRLLFKPTQK